MPVQTQTVARWKFQRGTGKNFHFALLKFLFFAGRSGSFSLSCLTSTTINDGEPEDRHSQIKRHSQNHFRLHECKFEKTSNYLASKLTSDNNIQRLREILAQLQTIAAKLEEISEQMSAFMTLDDLEPFLQKSADFSLFFLHYADKIDNLTQSAPSRSSSTCAPFERRCEDSHSAPTNPASQQQQNFATAPNNTTRLPQNFINSGQPVTRAPSQPHLPTHIMDVTGPELFRYLGCLDNSHVSTTAHQDFPTLKIYKETASSIRNNRTWPLKPFLNRSVNRIWTTQLSLSLANNNHGSWTTQSSLSQTNSHH